MANYSPAVLPLEEGQLDEWKILARLALVAQGMGADADPAVVDDLVVGTLVGAAVADETGPIAGRDPDEIIGMLGDRTGPERLVDLMLRTGPYGDGFGADPERPLARRAAGQPARRRPGAARAPAARRAAHAVGHGRAGARADPRRRGPPARARSTAPDGGMTLIGRRDLRSNNSWMHNVEVLVKGKPRCTLHVHPDDAARLGLTDGADAAVSSRTGEVAVPVEVTDAIRPGRRQHPARVGARPRRASSWRWPAGTRA